MCEIKIGEFYKVTDVIDNEYFWKIISINRFENIVGILNSHGYIVEKNIEEVEEKEPIIVSHEDIPPLVRHLMNQLFNYYNNWQQQCEIVKSQQEKIRELKQYVGKLKGGIRELKYDKVKILEVDQWTSTGDVEQYSMDDFELENIHGGDADTIKEIGIASVVIKEVYEDTHPNIGRVWFREDEQTGKLKKWKCNYDSSD